MGKDYYKILGKMIFFSIFSENDYVHCFYSIGISKGASEDEVKKAYRKL
jgi:DnaJ-class molecular chaperone